MFHVQLYLTLLYFSTSVATYLFSGPFLDRYLCSAYMVGDLSYIWRDANQCCVPEVSMLLHTALQSM